MSPATLGAVIAAVAVALVSFLAIAFLICRDLENRIAAKQTKAQAPALRGRTGLAQVTPFPRPPAPPRPLRSLSCSLVCRECGKVLRLETEGTTNAEIVTLGRAAGWHVGINGLHDRCPEHKEGASNG